MYPAAEGYVSSQPLDASEPGQLRHALELAGPDCRRHSLDSSRDEGGTANPFRADPDSPARKHPCARRRGLCDVIVGIGQKNSCQ
jgi:hypothetical protein